MTTLQLSIGAAPPVDLYTRDRRKILGPLVSWPVFRSWLARTQCHFDVEKIEVQSVDFVGRGHKRRILFAKIKAHATDRDGNWVPGIVLLRGDVVSAVVTGIRPDGREDLIKVDQARLSVSDPAFHEVVAGMVDDGNPLDKIVGEIEEEIGIKVDRDEVIDLTALAFPDSPRGIACSPGAFDAFSLVYLVRVVLDEANLATLGGLHGAAGENEHTRTELVPLERAWRTMPDALSLAALHLYEKLRDQLPL